MATFLAIQVRLHDGRYHGAGDWPPAPARLFQALIAGAGRGRVIPEPETTAFKWLETLPPPEILAPQARETRGYTNYVPNNDLDAKKGDPRNISAIRTGKTIHARLFDETLPVCYVWTIPDDSDAHRKAHIILDIASRLYQLGRGIDMAWATGDIMDEGAVSELRTHPGLSQFSPGSGARGVVLATPCVGTYRSLEIRYQAGGRRFSVVRSGSNVSTVLAQAPKPRFHTVAYNSPPAIHLFDIRQETADTPFSTMPLVSAASLTPAIRDAAVKRLRTAEATDPAVIERCLIGKNRDGSHTNTAAGRIRIIPIPSFGHQHVDMAIRRVVVSIPSDCPIPIEDVLWAFSGLKLTLAGDPIVLLPSTDESMMRFYAPKQGSLLWRSITPLALPESAARRRIDPRYKTREAKHASEKAGEESIAAVAVTQALRHAGLEHCGGAVVRLSRTPLHLHGAKADLFAVGSRFAKERLWHVEIKFSQSVDGPLILGDGRFYGLGLFAPTT